MPDRNLIKRIVLFTQYFKIKCVVSLEPVIVIWGPVSRAVSNHVTPCDDDELHVALGVIPSVPLWSCEQLWFLKGVCVTAV